MLSGPTLRGANFTGFHAGPMEEWTQFRLEPPTVPLPAKGKLFLQNLLGSAGLEISLNVVPPGTGMPFLHRHQQNDEVYVVVGGRGQFLVDGECIDVAEGSVLCMRPPAARACATTPMRRCTSSAFNTEPTAQSRAARVTDSASKVNRSGRTDNCPLRRQRKWRANIVAC